MPVTTSYLSSASSPSENSVSPALALCRVLTATMRLAACRARPRHRARPDTSILGGGFERAVAAYMVDSLGLFDEPRITPLLSLPDVRPRLFWYLPKANCYVL